MLKRLLGAALALLVTNTAWAQKTPSAIQSEINSQIKSNGAGAITGPILNGILNDIATSYGGTLATNTWTSAQTFSANPTLSACTGYLYGNASSAATCAASVASSPYTYPATGGVAETLSAKVSQMLDAADFGDSGSSAATTCSISSSSNALTLAPGHDFAVGNGILCQGAGATFSAGAPSSLSAVQNGTTGATSIQYALSTDDGNGGLSIAQTVTVANANAAQTTLNNVTITFTPANNFLPVVVWKKVGAGSWTYIGSVLPQLKATIANAGSGYTNGAYWWSATGGTCPSQPAGSMTISGGSVTAATAFPYWTGCTGTLPTVPMPVAAGAGSNGSVTIAWTGVFVDAGTNPSKIAQPWYTPATPPASAQNDWLVGTISALNGNAATLSVSASNTVSAAYAQHDETAAIQAAINGAAATAQTSAVKLNCGTHNISSALLVNQPNIGIYGEGMRCAKLTGNGIQNDITFQGASGSALQGAWEQGVFHNDGSKTAGWAVYANYVNRFWLRDLLFNQSPGGFGIFGMNDVRIDHIRGVSLLGQGYSDFLFEANGTVNCCVDARDMYSNDGAAISGKIGNTTRRGVVVNNINTVVGGNNGISNAEGYGWWIGNPYAYNSGSTNVVPEYVQQFAAASEFATVNNHYIHDGKYIYFTNSYSNAALNVNDNIWVGPAVNLFQWLGGTSWGASGLNFNIFGSGSTISGANIGAASNTNAGGTAGTYCGIELQASAIYSTVTGNTLGDPANPTFQKCPVQLDSGATYNTVVGNTYSGNVNSTPADNSASTTNVIGLNANDTSPGMGFDNVHQVFGVGDTNLYGVNGSNAGIAVRLAKSGSDVRSTIWNNASAASTTARYSVVTGTANSNGAFILNDNNASPFLQIAAGTAVTDLRTSIPVKLQARVSIADEGTCTMASGACTAQSLSATYSAAPKCVATWTGTGTLAGQLKITSTTTTATPASSTGTDTAQVNWTCFGN